MFVYDETKYYFEMAKISSNRIAKLMHETARSLIRNCKVLLNIKSLAFLTSSFQRHNVITTWVRCTFAQKNQKLILHKKNAVLTPYLT